MKNKFYINSFPYALEQTARLCHENAKRLLESITDKISIDEFAVLDTIIAKPELSQADLARLILKGKAHTGRFLMSLEEKGFVERHVREREGKLIKVATATQKGLSHYKEILTNLKPSIEAFEKVISEREIAQVKESLKTFRTAIEETSKIVFE
jgi:DNA-binding MarR family transcriptional regulator